MKKKHDMSLAIKGKKTDPMNMLVRKITIPLTNFTAKYTTITPNQISIFNLFVMLGALISLGISGYTSDPYFYRLVGAILVMVTVILDHVDGKLARARKISSLFGKWIDDVPNMAFTPLVFWSLAVGLREPLLMIIAALAMICFPLQFLFIYYFKSEFAPKLNKKKVNLIKKDNKLRYIYGTVYLHWILLITVIFNVAQFTLWFFAIFGNLFWIAVLALQLRAVIRYEQK